MFLLVSLFRAMWQKVEKINPETIILPGLLNSVLLYASARSLFPQARFVLQMPAKCMYVFWSFQTLTQAFDLEFCWFNSLSLDVSANVKLTIFESASYCRLFISFRRKHWPLDYHSGFGDFHARIFTPTSCHAVLPCDEQTTSGKCRKKYLPLQGETQRGSGLKYLFGYGVVKCTALSLWKPFDPQFCDIANISIRKGKQCRM